MKKPTQKTSPFWQESPLVDEKDIFSDLTEKGGTSLFLSKYSMTEVLSVLRKRNFFNDARKRNLWPLVYELDSSEFPLQRFQVFLKDKKPENLVVDLKIREGTFKPKKELPLSISSEYKFLILDWLTLQNPLLNFSPERTALPGQKYPGLSLSKKIMDVFIYLARVRKNDGILAFPAYFHNALLFMRYLSFLNPDKEAEVLAIKNSFPELSFKQLAWIVYLDCLKRGEGQIYKWEAEEQIYPFNKKLKDYFNSKEYKKRAKENEKKFSFSIDWDCYQKKIKKAKS
jgi:hypothetical protein